MMNQVQAPVEVTNRNFRIAALAIDAFGLSMLGVARVDYWLAYSAPDCAMGVANVTLSNGKTLRVELDSKPGERPEAKLTEAIATANPF